MKVEPLHTDHKQASIKKCPRCGKDHNALIFEPLSNPDDERDYFAWCIEDERLQPILVKGSELG